MKKALLIINPSSGGEKAKSYEDKASQKLQEFFDEIVIKYTEKAGDATNFAKKACEENFNSVFVMGGDGTVNEGISGLAEQKQRPNFGFFPLGTVNDLARALGIPLDPDKAIEEFDVDYIKPLDIGKINDKYFMNVVAIGTIPEAINQVESKDKTNWGAFAYFASAVKELINMQNYSFVLEVDGEKTEITSSTVLVGSTNSIGGFEQILPKAKVNDGVLHLIYLKDSNIVDSIMAVPNLLSGVKNSTENLEYLTFKEATISLKEKETSLKVNVDGDEGDSLPVRISVLPSHLRVYCGKSKFRKKHKKYNVITLCGSTKFKNEFIEMQKKLTLEENVVISVGLFGHSGDNEVWENMDEGTVTKTKQMLDDIHKAKIDLSDEIFVINVGGYIGDSTKSEIEYAKKNGKNIRYLEDVDKI